MKNTDRLAQRGYAALKHYADLSKTNPELETMPHFVVADLLADLMHWASIHNHDIDFADALDDAKDNYQADILGDFEIDAGTSKTDETIAESVAST